MSFWSSILGFVFEPISVLGGMFGLSRTLRPSQNRVPKKDLVLEGSKAQRGRLDGEIPPYFARLERGHLSVICLGKTRRNSNIIIELMFRFRVVFYRETKWPKCRLGGSQDVTGNAVMMSWERNGTSAGPLCRHEASEQQKESIDRRKCCPHDPHWPQMTWVCREI